MWFTFKCSFISFQVNFVCGLLQFIFCKTMEKPFEWLLINISKTIFNGIQLKIFEWNIIKWNVIVIEIGIVVVVLENFITIPLHFFYFQPTTFLLLFLFNECLFYFLCAYFDFHMRFELHEMIICTPECQTKINALTKIKK